jgi:hypothetical protein
MRCARKVVVSRRLQQPWVDLENREMEEAMAMSDVVEAMARDQER